jgi:hypothetical protein
LVVRLPVVALVPDAVPALVLVVCKPAPTGIPANSSPRTTALVALLKVTVTESELPPLMPIEYHNSTLPVLPVMAPAFE